VQISPNTAAIIKIILGLLTAITSGTLSFTGLVEPQTNVLIVACASSAIVIIGIVMSGFSSSAPGALAPPDAPVVVAATAVANLPKNADPGTVALTKKVASEAVTAHQP
jgi:hypothetical protein